MREITSNGGLIGLDIKEVGDMNCDGCVHNRVCKHSEMYKTLIDMIQKVNQTEPIVYQFSQPRCIYFEDPKLGVKEDK